MTIFRKLDSLLKGQEFGDSVAIEYADVMNYARCLAAVENVIAVVSDLKAASSRIFAGSFARLLDFAGYEEEDSIWETAILRLMSESEREAKFMAELRFFHYLRHLPRHRRPCYHMMSKLRFSLKDGGWVDVLHRMYYVYDRDCDTVRYAICLYGPLAIDFIGKSVVVDSVTGAVEELAPSSDSGMLSRREKQVLALIDCGKTSAEIAEMLSISRHTVSRHRQEILAKLQVKNSVEACRLAKSLSII